MVMVTTTAQATQEARTAHGRFMHHVRKCGACQRLSSQGRGWCTMGQRLERIADTTGNRAEAWSRGY